MFFNMLQGLSLKQTEQIFLEGESTTLTDLIDFIQLYTLFMLFCTVQKISMYLWLYKLNYQR